MIVSAQDLIDYMSGINLNAPQETAAEFVLKGIQADLERYLHRPLEPRLITETVVVDDDGRLRTTQDPIVGLVEGQPFRFFNKGIYATGSVQFTLASLGVETATVTYIAGYDAREEEDTVNEFADVRLAIMRVAAREMTNRHDDTLSVKGLETDNVGEPTGPQNGVQGWTMDELRMHDRLRKRVIA